MIPVDLHCHSVFSDGRLSPAELLALAKSNGCKLLALTDHDNIAGLETARAAALAQGIAFVNGVELSVNWEGQTLHIVGLNFTAANREINEYLDSLRGLRRQRLELISTKLAALGITGVSAGALALAANREAVGRPHIARYLTAAGYVTSEQQAFRKYLGTGKVAAVNIAWPELAAAVAALTAAGGTAVLAHPFRYGFTLTKLRRLLAEFTACGGRALEVATAGHNPQEIQTAALLVRQFKLAGSAGSDFHGREYDRRAVGISPDLPPDIIPLWQTFN